MLLTQSAFKCYMHALQGWNGTRVVSLLPKLISAQDFQVTFCSCVWVKKSRAPCSAMTIQVHPQPNPENFCMNTSPGRDRLLWTRCLPNPESLTKTIFSAGFSFTSNTSVTKWEIFVSISFSGLFYTPCKIENKCGLKAMLLYLLLEEKLFDTRWVSENVLFLLCLLLFICSSYIVIRANLRQI